MRYSVPVACGLLITIFAQTCAAQESKAPWWHFGKENDSPSAAPSVTPAPTLTPAPETITPVEEESFFSWPAMPEWKWPSFSHAEATAPEAVATGVPVNPPTNRRAARSRFGREMHQHRPRNTWAQQPASTTPVPQEESTWVTLKDNTRSAWNKTVDFVTPGPSVDEPAVVATQPRPSWWKRMWSSEEQTEGPQTVTEWMAQDRLDP